MGRAHRSADAAAGGVALTPRSHPARPGTEALADDVAQRCRAGLGAAASALYGRDATATARALRARAEGDAARWPWLPGLCYSALESLGVAFDRDDRVVMVAGKALVGLPVRPERVTDTSRRLRQPEPPAPPEAPDPALAAAVDRFWARLTGLAQRLGQAVRAGDEEAVTQLLQRARPKLRDSAAAVQEAAEAALGGWPVSAERSEPARPEPEPEPETPGPEAPGREAPGREPLEPEPSSHSAEPASGRQRPASADSGAVPVEPAPEAEEDEAALGPDRPYAPMIFVGLALLVALVLLLAVALGTLGS